MHASHDLSLEASSQASPSSPANHRPQGRNVIPRRVVGPSSYGRGLLRARGKGQDVSDAERQAIEGVIAKFFTPWMTREDRALVVGEIVAAIDAARIGDRHEQERLQRERNYAQWREDNPDLAKLTSLSRPLTD
jgi:hypothetical protein